VLAVPAVPIVEDHVYARRVLRQIIDAKELHDRGAFAAATARIELPDTQQLGGRTPTAGLAHCAADLGWKAVEVLHRKPLWVKGKVAFACVRIDGSAMAVLREIFGTLILPSTKRSSNYRSHRSIAPALV
jgi:hypothetical protein